MARSWQVILRRSTISVLVLILVMAAISATFFVSLGDKAELQSEQVELRVRSSENRIVSRDRLKRRYLRKKNSIADEFASQTKSARAVLEVHETMIKGETYILHLWLEGVEAGGSARIGGSLSRTPEPAVADDIVEINAEAAATLTGNRFTIDPPGSIWQRTFPRAHWSWRVVPNEEGTGTLVVALQHKITVPDTEDTIIENVSYYPQSIAITVRPMERVTMVMETSTSFLKTLEGMLAALGAVAVLVAGLIWRKRSTE